MKSNLLLIFTAVVLMACQTAPVRYTQQSPEIETFKAMLKSYENKDVQGMNAAYADTAQIFVNTDVNGVLASKENASSMEGLDAFTNPHFEFKDSDIEMVVTDKGETWVNFWGSWKGAIAANGEPVAVAVHMTARFIDGKIVREYDYFDASGIEKKFEEMSAANAAMADSSATAVN